MRRAEKYKQIAEKLAENFPLPLKVCLSSGIVENGNGGTNGFLAFDSVKNLDAQLPSEIAIIMPIDGVVNYSKIAPLKEQAVVLVITKSDAFLYANAICEILDCEFSANSISTNLNYLAQIGAFPFSQLPRFIGSGYSVAAIIGWIQYNRLKGNIMDCLPTCCNNTIKLGCFERCEIITIANLQPSTLYAIFAKVPNSANSTQKIETFSDALGNLSLPIDTIFSGEYFVRIHQNNATSYDCIYFTINP